MKQILIITLLFFSVSAYSAKTLVSSAGEITTGSWVAGDTIIMENGTWIDQNISLKAEGTPENPVVLMAEAPGGVILTGTSRISFSGKYIIIRDLHFKNGDLSGLPVVSFRTSSSVLADNCRLTNTIIENYNPPLKTTDSKWVSIYGMENRVDHCTFVNKTNSGTLLVVWLKTGVIPAHTIDHNFFGYRIPNLDSNGKELNGQEIIRIGDSSTSMETTRVVVSDNYFEHCNGEIEIISNKSCENVYKNNVFYECVGMLTLRHGNRCVVDGNYFFGNGISNTGGVRIIGEDHKVYNNYFENLEGSGYRSALCIVRGKEDSELNEYFQVKNAEVMYNTFVDCKQSFGVNYNSSTSLKLPPIGTSIAHNHIYNTSTSPINVYIYQTNVAEMDVSWKNNLFNQGKYSGFDYTADEVITGIDPSMVKTDTEIEFYEPDEGSALVSYVMDEFPDVVNDIRGRERGSDKIPGASQLNGTITSEMPTKETAGAGFYVAGSNSIQKKYEKPDFDAWMANRELVTRVQESGVLSVFDMSGKCIHQQKIVEGSNNTNLEVRGIYLVRFIGYSGNHASRLISFN